MLVIASATRGDGGIGMHTYCIVIPCPALPEWQTAWRDASESKQSSLIKMRGTAGVAW